MSSHTFAQRQGKNCAQNDDGDEYVEMGQAPLTPTSDMGIYFSPCDTNGQNPTFSSAVPKQEVDDGAYSLPESSEVYHKHARREGSQKKQAGTLQKPSGWNMATNVQITTTLMILIICVTAFSVTLITFLDGRVHCVAHKIKNF